VGHADEMEPKGDLSDGARLLGIDEQSMCCLQGALAQISLHAAKGANARYSADRPTASFLLIVSADRSCEVSSGDVRLSTSTLACAPIDESGSRRYKRRDALPCSIGRAGAAFVASAPADYTQPEPDLTRSVRRNDQQKLAVGRSALYRAFAPFGGVQAYLRKRRLEAAHALLVDPKEPRSITEIAFGFHFVSMSHFSRAFRSRFGYSPRQARHGAASVRKPIRIRPTMAIGCAGELGCADIS